MPVKYLTCVGEQCSSSAECCGDTITNVKIENNILYYYQGDTWIFVGSVCCDESSSSSSSSSSSGIPVTVDIPCCERLLPETVFVAISNKVGPCDHVPDSLTLVWNGFLWVATTPIVYEEGEDFLTLSCAGEAGEDFVVNYQGATLSTWSCDPLQLVFHGAYSGDPACTFSLTITE